MKVFFYNLIRRFFPQEYRNHLKKVLLQVNFRIRKVLIVFYGKVNNEELLKNITQKLGIGYDILMIHSSFNDMLPMYTDNLKLFLNKLIEYCSINNITLAMPAFILGDENYDLAKYYSKNFFDVNKSKSQMGLLTELFRRYPGVKRSIHPTHSVCAFGPLADKLTRDHHLQNTKCGIGTPFGYMSEFNTKILGIGTKYYRVLTQVNSAEDMLKEKFPIQFNYNEKCPVSCINQSGDKIIYSLPIIKREYIRDANKVKNLLRDAKIFTWKFKGISMFLTQAKDITDTLVEAAKNGKTIYSHI